MKEIRILELFAGIGACSKALEKIFGKHNIQIVDAVEIDKYAIKSFNAIHDTNFEVQDIKNWDKYYENIDIITHGSPCQDFSLAGRQAGGDKGSGTRSSLMYETIRIVEKIKPKYVLWENVKNLLSKNHKHNFDAYLETMKNLGYNSYYQVLNAKDYGVPQNRERVFTISVRNDIKKEFVFPQKKELKIRLKDLLESKVDKKYYLSSELKKKLEYKLINEGMIKECDIVNHSYTLNRIEKDFHTENSKNNNLSPTLTTRPDTLGIVIKNEMDNLRIRKLTPKECWRLMGFNDDDFIKANQINSDAQLYKQAGNSIVVNVLETIFKSLFS